MAEVTPDEKGEYEMPKGKNAEPLHETDIELFCEGGLPKGQRMILRSVWFPVTPWTTLRLTPCPRWLPPWIFHRTENSLAVTGFHEALIHKADGSGLLARFVGLSERIESVCFSPDGKKLGITGGKPGRMGEVQIWDIQTKKLELSKAVTFDTLYGGSWSPDGKYFAFGAADTSIRVIDASNGNQVVYMAGHDDWVRDTVFSMDGKSVFP